MDGKTFWNKVLKGLKWFFFSFIWLGIIFLVVDIVTKISVVNYFKAPANQGAIHDPIEIIKGFLNIEYVVNDKAAFGMGFDTPDTNRIIYIIVAILGAGLIIGIYSWKYNKLSKITKACLMLMATGALGNLIDRIFYTPQFLGYGVNGVVDWINFYGIWGFHFNIADSCVVVGTLILIVYLIIDEIREVIKKRNKEVKQTGGKVLSKEEQSRLEQEQPQEVKEEEKAEPQEEKKEE